MEKTEVLALCLTATFSFIFGRLYASQAHEETDMLKQLAAQYPFTLSDIRYAYEHYRITAKRLGKKYTTPNKYDLEIICSYAQQRGIEPINAVDVFVK